MAYGRPDRCGKAGARDNPRSRLHETRRPAHWKKPHGGQRDTYKTVPRRVRIDGKTAGGIAAGIIAAAIEHRIKTAKGRKSP